MTIRLNHRKLGASSPSRVNAQTALPAAARRSARLHSGAAPLAVELCLPGRADQCAGWVIVARTGGAQANEPRLLRALAQAGFGTLSVDLLLESEAGEPAALFDARRLGTRLIAVTRWLSVQPEAQGKRLGYLAAGTAAGAALWAAAELGELVTALISIGGRADLAAARLADISAPVLLVANRRDRLVLSANRQAERKLNGASRLVVAPSFRYLRYSIREPGALEALLAAEWLKRQVAGLVPDASGERPSLVSLLTAVPTRGRAAAAATVFALLASVAGPALTAHANGATISINSGALTYDGSGASSDLTVTKTTADSSGNYVFSDPNEGSILLGTGADSCVANYQSLAYQVACPINSVGSIALDMKDGDDSVTLSLADGFAPTTVDGGAGTNSLVIDDSATTGYNDGVTLTGSTFNRDGTNQITYNNNGQTIQNLGVLAEPTNNAIAIQGTSANTTVNGGDGNDSITVGSGGTLDNIKGNLTVLGGSGTDSLLIDDSSFQNGFSLGGTTWLKPGADFKSGLSPRSGVGSLTFHTGNDIEALQINAGWGSNTLDASNFTSGPATLNGSIGSDLLIGTDSSGVHTFSDSLNGGGLGPGAIGDTVEAVQTGSNSVDFVLNNTLLTGQGNDTLTSISFASLVGGDGNDVLNASGWTLGPVTLQGMGGNDTLYGGGANYNDVLDGGTGTDRVVATADTNFTLSNSSLNSSALGNDSLFGIDEASLTGGNSGHVLNASAFTNGPVTLIGGTGNDTLLGGSGNDCLDGGGGITNTVILSAAGDSTGDSFALSNSNLTVTGRGSDTLANIQAAILTGGSGNDTMDVSGFSGHATLDGGPAGTDRLVLTANEDMFLYNDHLESPSGTTLLTLSGIDEASLTGGAGNNWIQAYTFSGPATLMGGAGDDTLVPGTGNDYLDGGTGNNWLAAYATTGAGTNFTLYDTLLTGQGNDTLANLQNAYLVGGDGGHLLDASHWDHWVQLYGGNGNDTLIGGTAGGVLDGGGGTANVVMDTITTAAADWQLTTNTLVGGGHGNFFLANIQQASLTGSNGNDLIDASGFTAGPVTLRGMGGNDTLLGGGANFNDLLDGGSGTDRVVASGDTNFTLTNNSLSSPAFGNDQLAGIDEASLTGGNGNNTLDASAFSNGPVTLDGGPGNDSLIGGAGNDVLIGGPGNNTIAGGGGTDTLEESGGSFTLSNTTLTGLDRNDSLLDSDIESAILTGGPGNDVLNAAGWTHGPVTLLGLGGNDTLTGGSGNDSLDGGAGTNMVLLSTAADTTGDSFVLTKSNLTVTGQGSDTLTNIQSASLTGGTENDTMDASGFSGSVTLAGGPGDDFLTGGSGSNSLDGGLGNDTLGATGDTNMYLSASVLTTTSGLADNFSGIEFASLTGGPGNNYLDASAFPGQVTIRGLAGDDTLVGGQGSALLDGGSGIDKVVYEAGNSNVTLSGSSVLGLGNDTLVSIESFVIHGGPGAQTFDASGFNFGVEFDGEGGNDTLIGSAFNDTLTGGVGNVTFIGNGGNDLIEGGPGTNLIVASGDHNFTLTPTLLSGGGQSSTISGIEQAVITGGVSSNLIDVSTFTGTVGLYGLDGNDTFALGSGGGTVDGGVGTNRVALSAASDTVGDSFVLSDSSLAVTGHGSYALSNIQAASLTGGSGNDTLDASNFTGNTTLDGQGGNDTLIGGSGDDCLLGGPGDDVLTGGGGANTLDGGTGTNRWVENVNFNISLVPLGLPGEKDDSVTNIQGASISGGSADLIFNLTGFTGNATLNGGPGNDSLTGGLGSDCLVGNGGNDTLVASTVNNDTLDGGSGVNQVNATGNFTFTLTDASLVAARSGGTANNKLINIQQAHLVGGDQNNLIDASAFGASQPGFGQVTLEGLGGNDTLIAGVGNASLDGGEGNDCLVGGPGNDTHRRRHHTRGQQRHTLGRARQRSARRRQRQRLSRRRAGQ